jgi:hypothetical protein
MSAGVSPAAVRGHISRKPSYDQQRPKRVNNGEAAAINELARRGFTDGFRVVDASLQVLRTGKMLRARDLVIREVYRFEGFSDPDDMAVVYAIESTSGIQGTLIDAFGVYADPAKAAALAHVPIRRRR